MADLVLYYKFVERLLVVTGKWVRVYSLYSDLKGPLGPSKKSKDVFMSKYHGHLDELTEVGNTYFKDSLKDWLDVRKYLTTNNAYDRTDATEFTGYIQYRNRSCNFRRMALRWTRELLKRLKEGKEVEFYTLHDYVASYQYYELERHQGGHHFKGLHKQS